MSREELGFALLFSLPVGVGVAIAVLKTTGGHNAQLAFGTGLVTALAIFLVVAVSVLHEPDVAK